MSQVLEENPREEALRRAAWWLDGNFAPVTDEVEAFDLEVEGALPPELTGVYMRNGPNPKSGASPHWFVGDGMLHGVRLERGRARWYRNRFVQTPRLREPQPAGDPSEIMDRTRSAANTSIVRHAGRFLALEEAHFPCEVTGALETIGPVNFESKLTTAFTAHPKFCPETGEMLAFGYGFMPPLLTYYRFGRDGRLAQATEIPVGGPTMIHDFCATRRHAIFMDLPIVFDMELAMKGAMPYRWSDDYQARLGVMPREGSADQIRWFDIAPCYIFHAMNAYEEGNSVVLDAARYERLWDRGWGDSRARLHRFTLDLESGRASEQELDDRPIEFPRVADATAGFKHRYGYAPMAPGERDENFSLGRQLLKFDFESGATKVCDFGGMKHPGEFVHAGEEDGGWLMGFVHDEGTKKSSFVMLDASDMKPVASVALPQRVPYGFHGNWFAD
ncbi:MAG TPA: carotenoid oxygenase family protein [Rhizomicrobium sp.]